MIGYALAHVGGVIGYVPLLTLLLPLKIERIAGPARMDVLTTVAIVGAIVASLANIAFGWLSDRTASRWLGRRGLAGLGVAALTLAYTILAIARTSSEIVVAVIFLQIALNALLAPLAAIMAEEIPDGQRGTVAGMLALSSPIATFLSTFLVTVRTGGDTARFGLVSLVVAVCVIPFLAASSRRSLRVRNAATASVVTRRELLLNWSARLLVQTGSIVISLYLLYNVEASMPGIRRELLVPWVAGLMFLGSAAAAPAAMILGAASDLTGRRTSFLVGSAGVGTAALIGMAATNDQFGISVGYVVYVVSVAVFVSIHTAYTMHLLPNSAHLGRDLGMFNITNTLPSLVGPLLAWLLWTPANQFRLLFVLAALTAMGGLAMLCVGRSAAAVTR